MLDLHATRLQTQYIRDVQCRYKFFVTYEEMSLLPIPTFASAGNGARPGDVGMELESAMAAYLWAMLSGSGNSHCYVGAECSNPSLLKFQKQPMPEDLEAVAIPISRPRPSGKNRLSCSQTTLPRYGERSATSRSPSRSDNQPR